MAIKSFNAGSTEVLVTPTVRSHIGPQAASDLPGGLYPLKTVAYEIDEYRIMAGWPVPIPPYDIHAVGLVSADGEILSNRDDNTAIKTNALIRWVADESYFDETALTWSPIQDATGTNPKWLTSVDYSPVLIHDYEYRVNDERFISTALNFDSDTRNHMWADFTATIGGSNGYTVIMVLSPNSSYGNNVDVPYNGLWCPGRATPVGDTFTESILDTWQSVTIQGGYLYLETESRERTRAISIGTAIGSNAPLYLAIVFGHPNTFFYAGTGPSSMRIKTIPTGDVANLMDNGVLLGRSTGDVLHTADMALFDVGVYADPLTADEIHDEWATLSASYGGDS